MIEDIDDDARTYLSAVGALAVYVAAQDGMPVRVGFCHDPRKALTYLARRWPRANFYWMAWFEDSKAQAVDFVANIMESAGALIVVEQGGVKAARSLPLVVASVEARAVRERVLLTPHAAAINRAKVYGRRLDAALATLQQSGEFGAFNHAYRIYRERRRMEGESALPYWAAKQLLRKTIVRWLVSQQRNDPAALLAEIREAFPWFKLYGPLHVAGRERARN